MIVVSTRCAGCGAVAELEWEHRPRNLVYCPACWPTVVAGSLPEPDGSALQSPPLIATDQECEACTEPVPEPGGSPS